MSWFLYALLAAFCLSTTDAFCKKALKETDELVVAWVRFGFALPFLFLFMLPEEIPPLDRTFWKTLGMLLPLEVTAIFLYIKAINISPLSLTIPFLSLTPVFLIVTSFLILGELPDRSGFMGIFLISGGAYLLNLHHGKKGILAPLQNIVKEKGSLMMIGVAFIYSITSNLGKLAVLHSNPIFFGSFYTLALTIILTPFALFSMAKKSFYFQPRLKTFLLIGLFYALMTICHYQAIARVEVAYMISIKRLSFFFSVLYGGLIFHEENIGERVVGSLVMILGVIFITLL
ncbi:MAG TPA: DMT family transporter [Thermodesulfobacteriota bacterium]|nr:DMT family transporter [Thermodesulfobacteriota bacterium]